MTKKVLSITYNVYREYCGNRYLEEWKDGRMQEWERVKLVGISER